MRRHGNEAGAQLVQFALAFQGQLLRLLGQHSGGHVHRKQQCGGLRIPVKQGPRHLQVP